MVRSSRIAGIISLFTVGASAVAISRQDNSKWTATNYKWGCSPGGCSSTFNLESPKDYPIGAPAFTAVCSPVYIQQDWVECKKPDGSAMDAKSKVYSVWQSGPDEQEHHISISHIYSNGSYYEARSGPNGFLPEQGATLFFVVNSVVAAADNHLPPPANSSPTIGVNMGENDAPAPTDWIIHELYAPNPTAEIPQASISEQLVPTATSTELAAAKPFLTNGGRTQGDGA